MNDGKKGFTLLELLIVVSMLGLLATLGLSTFPSALKSSRDAKRKSELKQYQLALERYANKNNGAYPASAVVLASSVCGTLGLTNCASDPMTGEAGCIGGTCNYYYIANSTTYVLLSRLERPKSATSPCFVVCSNGRSGEGSCPSNTTCPATLN